ncbi:MAG: hypothetical protein OXN84_05990 [Albidovulum sp.]|nr:hypothetical protein [Albidovulum sp.]
MNAKKAETARDRAEASETPDPSPAGRADAIQAASAMIRRPNSSAANVPAAIRPNPDAPAAESRASFRFSGILPSRDGFRKGARGNLVQGTFFGPDRAGAAGAFERELAAGAFGDGPRQALANIDPRLLRGAGIRFLAEAGFSRRKCAARRKRPGGGPANIPRAGAALNGSRTAAYAYSLARRKTGMELSGGAPYARSQRIFSTLIPAHADWPAADRSGAARAHARSQESEAARMRAERALIDACRPPLNVRRSGLANLIRRPLKLSSIVRSRRHAAGRPYGGGLSSSRRLAPME